MKYHFIIKNLEELENIIRNLLKLEYIIDAKRVIR